MLQPTPHSPSPDIGPIQFRTRPLPGPHPVGISHHHAIDPSRTDHQDHVQRQFMISTFFPATQPAAPIHARLVDIFQPSIPEALAYLTDGLESKTRDKLILQLRSIGLHSIRNVPPQPSGAPYPTLIYYPAGESNRLANADVCEALASQGFIVFVLDGPHDAPLVVFPNGHLCKGPLDGDYISPGVGDVGHLLSQLDELNRDGLLRGMIDTERVGIFGHSRGGYIANITAFLSDKVKAAASIDSYLWGSAAGLDAHPPDFQSRVRSTAKPLLRLCGRPAGSDPQKEAEFCLNRDGTDFIGNFSVVAFPGWSHTDFRTTPWTCGKGPDLLANQSSARTNAAETLTEILTTFFNIHLRNADPDLLTNRIRQNPALGLAISQGR